MLTAALCGLILGFLGSMPIAGPITVLILRAGMKGRYGGAMAIALGTGVAEGLYAALACTGPARLIAHYPWVAFGAKVLLTLILLSIAVYFFAKRPDQDPAETLEGGNTKAMPSGTKRTGFAMGFGLTAFNPSVITSWIAITAFLVASGWLTPTWPHATVLGLGTTIGVALWFLIFLTLLRRFENHLTIQVRHLIDRTMAWAMAGFAVFFGILLSVELQILAS